MLFYGVLLPLIDPAAEYRMAPEMWLHHVASVLGGLTAAALAAGAGGSVFAWLGAQMVVTEITTFLPVAFHQALKSRRMRGARSVVLGVLMPLAFGLRVVLSARVVVNLLLAVNALGGAASVPLWCLPLGLSTSATILGLNVYWLGKILAGSGRAVLKQRRAREVAAAAAGEGAQAQSAGSSGAGAGAAPRPRRAPLIAASAAFSDATGAAVYSELLEQKRRRPRPGAAA